MFKSFSSTYQPRRSHITSFQNPHARLRFSTGQGKPKAQICIIGSGPSGFFAAEHLMRAENDLNVQIDIYEKLPVPYGLVRHGVSPDHQEIKYVTTKFEALANDPRVRFVGNVEVGKDVSIDELRSSYDAILLAYGAEGERMMGIPGEDNTKFVHGSRNFVGWLNGHPDHREDFDFSTVTSAAIVGQGNVALDVARILIKGPEALKSTDITHEAISVLEKSKINTVHLIGRRGPAQAACTTAEFREIISLEGIVPYAFEDEMILNPESEEELKKNRGPKRQYELMQQKLKRISSLDAIDPTKKALVFHFLRNPTQVINDDMGNVTGIELERTVLTGPPNKQSAKGSGDRFVLPCQTVFRSIGYRSIAIPGVPFDPNRHVVPNQTGRVTDLDGNKIPGMYTCGWVKRGPSGIIGTNRFCAEETVESMLQDVKAEDMKWSGDKLGFDTIGSILKKSGIRHVSFEDWGRVNKVEEELGKSQGKPRTKITTREHFFKHL